MKKPIKTYIDPNGDFLVKVYAEAKPRKNEKILPVSIITKLGRKSVTINRVKCSIGGF